MPISHDASGIPWLEPKHIDLRVIAADLDKMPPDAVAAKYAFSPVEWRETATEMAALYRQGAALKVRDDMVNAAVNSALATHALCFPPYGTAGDLYTVNDLLSKTPPDLAAIQKVIFSLVMHPSTRSLQLVGRFMKLAPFDEFSYLIDAATLAFYRGNIPAAFMTIVPVVEGVLLRWQGYPGKLASKPSFGDTLKFVAATATRQPIPLLPLFFDSWAQAATAIITGHLYRHTGAGPAVDHFNRHLALHLLEDQKFGTQENVTRAFLLIDILSELFICENRMKDPRWDTGLDEDKPHRAAYVAALLSQAFRDQPERVLAQFHPKCK